MSELVRNAWESLSPSWAREWITKIAVTVAIAVAWHAYQRWSAPPRHSEKEQPGVSRLLLDPLPQDLALEEEVVVQAEKESDDNNRQGDETNDGSPTEQNHLYKDDEEEMNNPTDGVNNVVKDDSVQEEIEDEDDFDESNAPAPMPAPEQAPSASSSANNPRTTATTTSSSTAATTQERPLVFRNTSRDHPGLDAFWYWCDVECSLFRLYSLGRRDGTALPPPSAPPRSRRGQVQVSMQVKNRTNRVIHVYWVDYKGREQSKGKIKPAGKWSQISWIEHPWVFRDEETDQVLLYYIPDRIIPTTIQQPTVDERDPEIGIHKFDFIEALPGSPYWVHIDDPVMPFPAQDYIRSIEHAADWALLHMHRMRYAHWHVLTKYLTNILYNPATAKYRQIRIANPTFTEAVWNSPARGLLFAMGFVEQGAYLELGTAKPLTREQTKQLSSLMFSVAVWRKRQEEEDDLTGQQPSGADGYGRAGFGRAGAMS